MDQGYNDYSLSSIRIESDVVGEFKSHLRILMHFCPVWWSMDLLPRALFWTLCQEPCFPGEVWIYGVVDSIEWLDLT